MNQFNLGQFVAKFVNYSLLNGKGGANNAAQGSSQGSSISQGFQISNEIVAQKTMQAALQNPTGMNSLFMSQFKMNHLASLDRALYIKDLMNLPKNIEQILTVLQNNMVATKELTNLLAANIELSKLAELIQIGGKEALNKLVLAMSNAAKQGMTDFSEVKDAMKLINASISAAGSKDNAQILKTFMLLYLPWLPLQEGVGFELEIETKEGGAAGSDSSITIMIATKNYGNIKIVLVLIDGASVSILVTCSDKFPKKDLLNRLDEESKAHSIQANIAVETRETKQDENLTPKAKVNMSNTSEINPFLLLMAHAAIRHTIEIDNQAGI